MTIEPLLVLCPSRTARLDWVLEYALEGLPYEGASIGGPLQGRRVLFALAADAAGMGEEALRLLRWLRQNPTAMEGCVGALLVDGASELYTKAMAQEFVLAANQAGCAFPGKPLVEGTGSLYNQHILAERMGLSWEDTYRARAKELAQRLFSFRPESAERPRLLLLHASESGRSCTLWLGRELSRRLEAGCDIAELSLRNGTIYDCRGCSYRACLHYAKNGRCFYGGAISETVLPAIRACNAMLFLCPNYNDAVGANFTALFNRLTSLLLQGDLSDKYVYGVIVSGYSGGDLVARQLLGAMCLNKTAQLPPRFCMLQTANDLQAAQRLPGIDAALDRFALQIRNTLCR